MRCLKAGIAALVLTSGIVAVAEAHVGSVTVDCTTATYKFWSFPEHSSASIAVKVDGNVQRSGTASDLGQREKTFTLPVDVPADGKQHSVFAFSSWTADHGGYATSRTVKCSKPAPSPTPSPTPTPTATPETPAPTSTPEALPPTPPVVETSPTPAPVPCTLTREHVRKVKAGQLNVIRAHVANGTPGTPVTLELPRAKDRHAVTDANGNVTFRVRPRHSGKASIDAGPCGRVALRIKPKPRTEAPNPPRVAG